MRKFAICIPQYNRISIFKNLINELITQIRATKYKDDIEICVSDNCSEEEDITDFMQNIINDNQDIAIKFVRQNENTGALNFNTVAEMSDSEYCMILGNDDRFTNSSSINAIMEILTEKREKDIDVLTFAILIGENKDFTPLYPALGFESGIVNDCNLWFSKNYRTYGLFGFLSNVIFKRGNWIKYNGEFFNGEISAFAHACIHLEPV